MKPWRLFWVLALAAAGNEPGIPQNAEMMRNGCGGHAPHRNELATGHVVACGDGFKNL